jgi:hypothetical protein
MKIRGRTTSISGDKNVFREAREIARCCTLPSYRDVLRNRVDEAQEAFDRFHVSASKVDFEELLAKWTRMLLAIDAAKPFVGPPPSNGGSLPIPTYIAA